MVICVTGKIGSGKSTVSKMISEFTGYEVIDVDRIGHEVLKEGDVKSKVKEVFTDSVFEEGVVNRRKLAQIVFEDEEKLRELERILHPRMRKKVMEMVRGGDAVIDCALLERMKLMRICDFVITVISSYENSRRRKPHLTDEEFRKIWENQRDVNMVGVVVENDGTLEDLRRKVKDVLEMVL